jgi:hypothetical protein
MRTPIILEALDLLVPALVLVAYVIKKIEKDLLKALFRIWMVALILGFGWELWGTSEIWEYPNYSFYVYDGVPLALPFAWGWWFMVSYLISLRLMQLIGNGRGAKLVSYYLSGVWFGNIESFAVPIGWWRYTYTPWFSRPWPLVSVISGSPVHIMVYLGWGILTFSSFLIATPLFEKLKKRFSEKISCLLLLPPAAVSGTVSWITVGLLTWTIETLVKQVMPF